MTAAKPASRRDRYDEVIGFTEALRTDALPAVSACLRLHGVDPQQCVLYCWIPEQRADVYLLITPGYMLASVAVPRDGGPAQYESERLQKGRRTRELDFAFRWVRTGAPPG